MRKRSIALIGLVALAWVMFPSKDLALKSDCSPNGIALIHAAFYGKWFWERQLSAIDEQRRRLTKEELARQEQQRKNSEISARVDKIFEDLYRENPGMKPSDARLRAEALRAQADSIEEAEWTHKIQKITSDRIEWLSNCERKIAVGRIGGTK